MPPKKFRGILRHILMDGRPIEPPKAITPRMAATNEHYHIRFTMKAEGEDAEVMVYSEIASGKIWGDETTEGDFDKALKEAKKNGAKNLNIRINSPGGEVYAAVAMRSMVINAGFDKVRVMIEGLCASAATLFATIPGAHVVIAEGSEFMIHNPMTITWGNANEIEDTVEHLRKMEQQFHGMYAAKTGQTEDQIKEWMDATTWFTAKEAVDYGFCDELLASEKIAACVTKRDMALMNAVYGDVPETVTVKETADEAFGPALDALQNLKLFGDNAHERVAPNANNPVSNGTPVAGVPTENKSTKEEKKVELTKDTTVDQLREEAPALLAQVQQEAVAAERERLSDIDALTMPGYEELAQQAKDNGTSAMDFQKQIVKAQREEKEKEKAKGAAFVASRQQETAHAAEVAGGSPQDNTKTEEQEITDNAKDIAEYAKQYNGIEEVNSSWLASCQRHVRPIFEMK